MRSSWKRSLVTHERPSRHDRNRLRVAARAPSCGQKTSSGSPQGYQLGPTGRTRDAFKGHAPSVFLDAIEMGDAYQERYQWPVRHCLPRRRPRCEIRVANGVHLQPKRQALPRSSLNQQKRPGRAPKAVGRAAMSALVGESTCRDLFAASVPRFTAWTIQQLNCYGLWWHDIRKTFRNVLAEIGVSTSLPSGVGVRRTTFGAIATCVHRQLMPSVSF
jgi:hypothetical protein